MPHEPAAAATDPCAAPAAPGYGSHPDAHEAIRALAKDIEGLIAGGDDAPQGRVAELLAGLLGREGLLAPVHRAAGADGYRRHVLHADPDGRFTILSLIWQPGQETPIHGHTVWCAMGVHEGTPTIRCFDVAEHADGTLEASLDKTLSCAPGESCALAPGLGDVHRVSNETDETIITLHVYGCDLVQDAEAVNLPVAE